MAGGRQQQQHEMAVVVRSADELGALVVNSGKKFIKRHPVISLSWVVGLFVSILASGYTPSPEAVMNYEVRYYLTRTRRTRCGRLQYIDGWMC